MTGSRFLASLGMTKTMKWLEEINPEELGEHYEDMTRLIGLENTVKLAEHFGKQGIYFRSLDELIAKKKKEYIIKNFNGANHRELARATNYSLQWVYEIIKDDYKDKQNRLL